jgi:hypothetical protein
MFDIAQLRAQIEALIRAEPDMEQDATLRADMLDGETDIRGVLTRLVAAADYSKWLVDGINGDLGHMVARKQRHMRRVEGLRAMMLSVLQSADLKRFDLFKVTLLQRHQPQQIVGEVDPDKLPDDLCRITREADRAAVRDALLHGRHLPGLSLSNSPPGLTIKGK